MATKAVSTANTGAKKPRGKPFEKGKDARREATQFTADDPRRNNNGQRSAAAVAFTRDLRELIVTQGQTDYEVFRDGKSVGKKPFVEWMVERVWMESLKGEAWAVNFIADRTEGKVSQPIDALLRMIDVSKLNDEQLERLCNGEDIINILFGSVGASQSEG